MAIIDPADVSEAEMISVWRQVVGGAYVRLSWPMAERLIDRMANWKDYVIVPDGENTMSVVRMCDRRVVMEICIVRRAG